MAKESILESIYYGGVSPWERNVVQTPEYKEEAKKSCDLHNEVRLLLGEKGKQLFDDFLDQNCKLTSYFEEEKFKDGFILGVRLMIETFTDKRFLE